MFERQLRDEATESNTFDWAWFDWMLRPTTWVHGFDSQATEPFIQALRAMDSQVVVYLPRLPWLGPLDDALQALVDSAMATFNADCPSPWL